MTTLIGCKGKDWTLLVADRRVYTEDYYREETKIFNSDHWIYSIAGYRSVTDPVLIDEPIGKGHSGLLAVAEKLTNLADLSIKLNSDATGMAMMVEKSSRNLYMVTCDGLPWKIDTMRTAGKYQDEILFLLRRGPIADTPTLALQYIQQAVKEVVIQHATYLDFPLDYAIVRKASFLDLGGEELEWGKIEG